MSEQAGPSAVERDPSEPPHTGVARVDRVIADVETLQERPLEDHVAVFEAAHDQLRRALDADPHPFPGPRPGASA